VSSAALIRVSGSSSAHHRRRPAAERRYKGRHIEVRKHKTTIGQRSQRIRNRVARFVVPGLEKGGLGRADTEQDPQDLWMGYPLGQGRVVAAAAYLYEGEMKCRRVGDCLDVRSEVGIGSGNCRLLPSVQSRDRLRKIRLGVSKSWSHRL
jgi:hypothetical protein